MTLRRFRQISGRASGIRPTYQNRKRTRRPVLDICMMLTLLALLPRIGAAQTFTKATESFPDTYFGNSGWADYDSDGDLDVFLSGIGSPDVNAVFRNDSTIFVDINAGFPLAENTRSDWGDYDNDGDLDLILNSAIPFDSSVIAIYRNDGNDQFTQIDVESYNAAQGAVVWGDYDNDGDLDFAVMGSGPFQIDDFTRIYRNDGNDTFVDINAGLFGMRRGSLDWGDYDGDGDLDLLQTGFHSQIDPQTRLYRNDGSGVFTLINAGFTNLYDGAAYWGDFDMDGDLDVFLDGSDTTAGGRLTFVYLNDGDGTFTDLQAQLPGAGEGSDAALGDADNDGDLDVFYTSFDDGSSNVLFHDGGQVFAPLDPMINSGCCGSANWVDYDLDGDLDLFVTGLITGTALFENEATISNTPPTSPGNLAYAISGDTVTLTWSAATDAQTPAPGLTYNVRVGTTIGGVEIVSPMADPATGFRKIVRRGNADERLSYLLIGLPDGIYHWSVQAIDNSFAGSSFAAEANFVVGGASCCIGDRGNSDGSSDEAVTLSDLSKMIDNLFISLAPLSCWEEGNLDGSLPEGPGSVTLGDLSVMIDHLFISLSPLPSCP